MTTTLLTSDKKRILDRKKYFVSNIDYTSLPEKIKEYLLTKFEGFLINKALFCEREREYKLSIERGNLEVNLTFAISSELTQIRFDY